MASATVESRRCDCPGCGATLIFAADLQKLRCEYCDAEVDISRATSGGAGLAERKLEELLKAEEGQGYGVETKVLHCKQCGADINFPDKVTSGACCFCGCNTVIEKSSGAKVITPGGLIPFQVTRDQANQKFREWVASLWFRPNDLKKLAQVRGLEGVYTPFWTFDAQASTRWTAESGYHYWETEEYKDAEGKTQTRQVQKTRWESSSGHHKGSYDDLLICASKGIPEALVRALEPFNTVHKLVAYQSSFLSGWGAEEYGLAPKDAWQKGQERFEQEEYGACGREVPGDTYRNLSISMQLANITWKHCLLPVYVAAYRYGDKSYRFLVNGETGKVSGEAPYSWWKIVLTVLAVVLLVLFLFGMLELAPGGPPAH